jgi:hypothetical protein
MKDVLLVNDGIDAKVLLGHPIIHNDPITRLGLEVGKRRG